MSAPNPNNKGRMVSKSSTRPAIEVDCSSWGDENVERRTGRMETVSNVRAAQELDFTGLPEQASAAPPAPSEAAAQPAHLAVELATLAEVGAWIGAVIACGATYDLIKDVLKRAIRRFGPKSLKEIKRHAVEKLKESTETPPADMEAAKKAIDAVFADFE